MKSSRSVFHSSGMEQQTNVKFCVRLGKTLLQTCQLLREVYGNQALSQSAVQEIYRSLGENCHEDDKTIEIRDLLKEEPTYGTDMLGNLVGMTTEQAHSIVTEKLQLRQICNRLVPNPQSVSERRARLAFCRDLTLTAGNDSNFLSSLVSSGIVWCSELCLPAIPFEGDPNVVRPYPRHWLRTRLVVFFDALGVIHKEFMPEGETLNADYQEALMRRLCVKIKQRRPQYRTDFSWSLLYDGDSLGHRFLSVRHYLNRKNVSLIDLPANSPDLSPCEFFLFPLLKQIMDVTEYFDNMPAVQRALKVALASIPEDEYERAYGKLIERCVNCITAEGQYFRK